MRKTQYTDDAGTSAAGTLSPRRRKLLIAIAVLAACAACLVLLFVAGSCCWRRLYLDNTAFSLKNIRIENCHDDKVQLGVLQTLEIHQVVEGKSTLPAIPVGKIRKMLISDPRISNAEVTRIFPDTLRIAITERQPVAVLRFNRNYRHNDLYIDRDGYVIPANISAGGETLPIVIGLGKPVDYPIGQKANDLALLAFLTFLRESKLRPEGSLYEVQLCRLEQENNEMHLHLEARGPFKPSAELVLPTSNIPQNLERIKVIVTLLMEENRTIRYMNAKYDRIPVRN